MLPVICLRLRARFLRWLRALFYPDRCGYEVEDAVLEFYALFYHVELEDDQLAALFTD